MHADLRRQFQELQRTYDSMLSWEPAIPKPPLIDSFVDTSPGHRDNLPGYRAFLEAVERDLDVMEKVCFLRFPVLSTWDTGEHAVGLVHFHRCKWQCASEEN